MKKPKFEQGDIVQVAATGIQGTVTVVDVEHDIYTVKLPGYTSQYTRPMLRLIVPAAEVSP